MKLDQWQITDKLSYYFWRIALLKCLISHDWKIVYTRVSVNGLSETYSGKEECKRCYESRYFSGKNDRA